MENNEILIEKGIKIPSRKKSVCKYPFEKMEIGDSFLIDAQKSSDSMVVNNELNWFNKFHQLNFKITTRFFDTQKKMRIWRIQ